MKICQNIDLVQLKVQSNQGKSDSFGRTYYLPKNVSWANEVVEKIVVAAPTSRLHDWDHHQYPNIDYPLSPISGDRIYTQEDFRQEITYVEQGVEKTQAQGIYFDIYKQGGEILAKDLSILSLLSTNNQVYEINSKLDLEQTCIHVPGKLVNDGVIWLYVFYGGHESATWQYPTENITVEVSLAPKQRLSFFDIINNYVHIQPNKIRGIYVWKNSIIAPVATGASSSSGVCVTLRDFNQEYIVNNVLDCLLGFSDYRHSKYYRDESFRERDRIAFDHDIDFDNSFIQNLYAESTVKTTIIFEY